MFPEKFCTWPILSMACSKIFMQASSSMNVGSHGLIPNIKKWQRLPSQPRARCHLPTLLAAVGGLLLCCGNRTSQGQVWLLQAHRLIAHCYQQLWGLFATIVPVTNRPIGKREYLMASGVLGWRDEGYLLWQLGTWGHMPFLYPIIFLKRMKTFLTCL